MVIDSVVLSSDEASIAPPWRPDDWALMLGPEDTPDFRALIDDFLAHTTVNGGPTLAAVLAMGAEAEAVLSTGEPSPSGGRSEYLTLSGGGRRLELDLHQVRLSSHFYEVFLPKMRELGRTQTTSYASGEGVPDGPPLRRG
ncbi:MAG: hypothetical protein R3F59_15995 [Myxococcota bacterium]